MEIIVTTSEVKISEENNLNQGEVNVHKVHFSFSKDYDGYTKYARFFVLDKKIDIEVDNEGFCDIPHEATQYKTEIRIGAYGEKVENEKLKRWSPTPTDKIVLEGTYNGEGTNTEELTPTDKQQMNERIQTNADNIESLNANKQDKLTEGDNITIDEDGVISATDTIYDDTEIRESIQSLDDEKVDKITGKGLSTNDFTNEDKSNLDSNTTNRHNHSNKSVLDSTTASYTTEEKTKLGGVASNAQVNVIESISVNGNQKTVTNKNVDIDVPTELSQLSGDSTHRTVSDTEKSTWNSKVDKEVNNLTNYYTKDEADAKLSSVYKYCGTVNNYSDLPSTNLRVGDVYNIVNADTTHHIKAGDNVAWNGSAWDVQSGDVDFSNYYTKPQVDAELLKKQNNINADNKVNSDFISDDGSTHKFTSAEEKTKLAGIESGAQVNLIEEIYLNGEKQNPVNKKIYLKTENAQIHKLRRSKNTSSSAWEKYGEFNKNLVANATHDGTSVTNDYDNLRPWSDIYSYNYDHTLNVETARIGDSNFKFDGTNGEVYDKFPESYAKIFDDDDYDYIWFSAWNFEGAFKINSFSLGRYETTVIDGVCHSYSGCVPEVNRNITSFRNLAKAKGSNTGILDWRYFVLQLFYLAEYADYNSQAKLGNCATGFRNNTNDKALMAESNANRILVSNAVAAYFDVGQQVSIGISSNGNFGVATCRTILSKEAYDDGTNSGTMINFDGDPVNIAVGNVIWTSAQRTGACDGLGMKSGSYASTKKSNIYRGVENPFGNVWKFIDGINIKDYQAYICYDPTEYVVDKFTSPYTALSYVNANVSDKYATKLGLDSNNPLIRLTKEASGGSDSTYMCDYYYSNSGNRILLAGGNFNSTANAGLWYFSGNNNSSYANYSIGSRLLRY